MWYELLRERNRERESDCREERGLWMDPWVITSFRVWKDLKSQGMWAEACWLETYEN